MSDLKHTILTTYVEQPDGSIVAVTESYFDELASRKELVIKKVKTSHKDFLSDIIACLDVVSKKQTKELILRITVDEYYNPDIIVKEYVVKRENYGRGRK